MSEYYIYSLVKDFVTLWSSAGCPEEYLSKLLHLQQRCVDKCLTNVCNEHIQTLANRSPNPELFLRKFEQMKSGSGDSELLSKYTKFLSLIQCNKDIVGAFKLKAANSRSRPAKFSHSAQLIESPEDMEKIYDELQVIGKEMIEKKYQNSSILRKVANFKKQNSIELTAWENDRPFASNDFSNSVFLHDLVSVAALPRTSQERYLVKDVLQCLLGFHGKFIRGLVDDDKRIFELEESIYTPFKGVVSEILVLAEYYSNITHFIEQNEFYHCGRVNQALCAILEELLQDFRVSIIHLELKHRKESLTLQRLVYNVQAYLESMNCLSKLVTTIADSGARGGRTLSLLHDSGRHYAVEHKAVDLIDELIRRASIPYFECLEQWINTGYVFDPCEEFMIDDNIEMDEINALRKGEFSHDYWKRRYRIKKDQVPSFLHQYAEKILRTGKYLNTIKQCKNVCLEETKEIMLEKPASKKLCYSSLNSDEFVQTIDAAYNLASDTLLNLLMNEYDIMNRLKSLKRYFLCEQGDFLSTLMDLCAEDFEKPVNEVSPIRLNSLVELAIRTCSGGKLDPYKNDIYLQTGQEGLALQIFKINSINTVYEKEYKNKNLDENLTGLDVIILHLKTAWPVSLIFNEKVIGCYQMLFRLLLQCKYVENLLCNVWIYDQQFKGLPKDSRKHYMKAFLLRRKMLVFIKNLNYYMTNEVIEQHWVTFMNTMKSSKNVDDVMNQHWKYLKNCMDDCMLTSNKLIKQMTWLLKNCINFCNFIQYMRMYFMDAELTSMLSPNDYFDCGFARIRYQASSDGSKTAMSSFEDRIKTYELEFNNNLGILLQLLSLCGIADCGNQFLHFLTRQNFNNYYNTYMAHTQGSGGNS